MERCPAQFNSDHTSKSENTSIMLHKLTQPVFYAWRYKLLCLEGEAINNIWTFCHDNFMTITFIFLFCSSHQHNLFKYWNIELWNINLGNLELRTVNYPAKIFTFPALNSNLFIMTWLSLLSPSDQSGQYFIISC